MSNKDTAKSRPRGEALGIPGGPASSMRLLMEGMSVMCFTRSGFLMNANAEFSSICFVSLLWP